MERTQQKLAEGEKQMNETSSERHAEAVSRPSQPAANIPEPQPSRAGAAIVAALEDIAETLKETNRKLDSAMVKADNGKDKALRIKSVL